MDYGVFDSVRNKKSKGVSFQSKLPLLKQNFFFLFVNINRWINATIRETKTMFLYSFEIIFLKTESNTTLCKIQCKSFKMFFFSLFKILKDYLCT